MSTWAAMTPDEVRANLLRDRHAAAERHRKWLEDSVTYHRAAMKEAALVAALDRALDGLDARPRAGR